MFFVFLCPSASSASESSTWASMARLVLNRANEFIHIHRPGIGLDCVFIYQWFSKKREPVCVCVCSGWFWNCLCIVSCVCVCVSVPVYLSVRACVRVCVSGSVRPVVCAETSRWTAEGRPAADVLLSIVDRLIDRRWRGWQSQGLSPQVTHCDSTAAENTHIVIKHMFSRFWV